MSGSSLFVPSGTAENALPRQFHGGRCVGIIDPPVEVDPDMPALLPAPSATLRSRAGGLPRCEVTDARERPAPSHAIHHRARFSRKHSAQNHLRTARTRSALAAIVHAQGVREFSQRSGVSCRQLRRELTGRRPTQFATVLQVTRTLGLTLHVSATGSDGRWPSIV